MVAKKTILQNLKSLNKLYNSARFPKENLFYAKLAVLELSGWVEESMDSIVFGCIKKKLKESKNIEDVKDMVSKNYGFSYENNFRKILINVIGIINVEKLERNVDSVKLQELKSTIGIIKKSRDIEAHTHISKIKTIDAPSVTMNNLQKIYSGLKEIKNTLKTIGF